MRLPLQTLMLRGHRREGPGVGCTWPGNLDGRAWAAPTRQRCCPCPTSEWCGDYQTRHAPNGTTRRRELLHPRSQTATLSGGDAGFPGAAKHDATPDDPRRLAGDLPDGTRGFHLRVGRPPAVSTWPPICPTPMCPTPMCPTPMCPTPMCPTPMCPTARVVLLPELS